MLAGQLMGFFAGMVLLFFYCLLIENTGGITGQGWTRKYMMVVRGKNKRPINIIILASLWASVIFLNFGTLARLWQ